MSDILTRIDSDSWAYSAPTGFYGLNETAPAVPDPEPEVTTPSTIFKWDNIASTAIASEDGMTLLASSTANSCGMTTQTRATGKLYWEYEITGDAIAGVSSTSTLPTAPGDSELSWGYLGSTGRGRWDNTNGFVGSTYADGDIIGVAVDLVQGKLWFSKNNVWQGANSPNPATDTEANYTNLSGDIRPLGKVYAAGVDEIKLCITPGQLNYEPPTGFIALQTDYVFGEFGVSNEISGYALTQAYGDGEFVAPRITISGVALTQAYGFGNFKTAMPSITGTASNPIIAHGDFKVSCKIRGVTGSTGQFKAPAPIIQGTAITSIVGVGNFGAPRCQITGTATTATVAYGDFKVKQKISGTVAAIGLPVEYEGDGNFQAPRPRIRGSAIHTNIVTGNFKAPRPRISGIADSDEEVFKPIAYDRYYRCNI